jgi:elongation factor Ts
MDIGSSLIKELRDATGISVMQCKKALEEAGGDKEKALIILRKKGSESAGKKSDRTLGAGAVGAYVHNTHEVASLVLLSCETDFVSKNEEFIALARDLAMQVSATSPKYIVRTEISEADRAKAGEVFSAEVEGKPEDLKAKILEGKLDAYFKDQVLLDQPFIKDPSRTIADLITDAVQKFGENIVIQTISRISVK